MSTVITNIGELVTNDPQADDLLGIVTDAAVVLEGDRVAWTGPAADAPAADVHVDAGGRSVIPGFVDSHSHLVFAGDRAPEFAARMAGTPYAAGGIRTTVAATRAATDEQLTGRVARAGRRDAAAGHDHGRDQERLRADRSATRRAAWRSPGCSPTRPPSSARTWCPRAATRTSTSRWSPARCSRPAPRTPAGSTCSASAAPSTRTRPARSSAAGAAQGLRGRLHANQLGHGPGVRLAAELGLVAVDHCTYLDDADVAALADSGTVATLLPGVEFSTRQPYPDARRLLDAGVSVAIASDCNPGSSYTSSMPLCVALAVREMGMTPAEATYAATAGGAAALDRADVGRLVPEPRADLVLLDAPSHVHLAYRPGVPLVAGTWVAGRPLEP